jgi:hypothetical protein
MPRNSYSVGQIDCRHPPRYDLLAELATFYLGYDPHALCIEFFIIRSPSAMPARRQRLLDLPVLLPRAFNNYSRRRYVAALRAVLERFNRCSADRPTFTDVPVYINGPPDTAISVPPEIGSQILTPPERTNQTVPEQPLPRHNSESQLTGTFDGEGVSERDMTSLISSIWGIGDHTEHHDFVRLAKGLGDALPSYLQNWFHFGEALGRCLWIESEAYLNEAEERAAHDVGAEVRIAASRTDFRNAAFVRQSADCEIDQDGEEDETNGEEDAMNGEIEQSAEDVELDEGAVENEIFDGEWGRDRIEQLVEGVENYLRDEPDIILKHSRNFLWFLGAPVTVSSNACSILKCFIESSENLVTRYYVNNEIWGDPKSTDRKLDQYLQETVNNITKALRDVDSPYYQGNDPDTRTWLRSRLFISSSGIGWQRGPLFQRMVIA